MPGLPPRDSSLDYYKTPASNDVDLKHARAWIQPPALPTLGGHFARLNAGSEKQNGGGKIAVLFRGFF